MQTAMDATSPLQLSYAPEVRPGTVGRMMAKVREGIIKVDAFLEALEAHRGAPWLTDAAYARLRELGGGVHALAVERYADLRALYDGYRERAVRILGPEGVAGL